MSEQPVVEGSMTLADEIAKAVATTTANVKFAWVLNEVGWSAIRDRRIARIETAAMKKGAVAGADWDTVVKPLEQELCEAMTDLQYFVNGLIKMIADSKEPTI